jgi:hypothetical protein
MGQYKVPQNVEAEDHILGPLTFKQFIYAIIGAGWGFLCFAFLRGVPALAILVGAPVVLLFFLLAFYNRDGQDFEHLLMAVVSFFAQPRRRLWVKEELVETFHIEPTKHAAEITQRNPAEVMSELEKLSTLIDSRGWNKPIDPGTGSHLTMPTATHEERLVAPPPVPHAPEEQPADMLDLQRSPLAQNLAELLRQAADDVRQEAVSGMAPGQQVAPAGAGAGPSISGVTASPSNDILRLATQSDDLSVAQVAAQATRIAPAYGQQMESQPNGN